jgi:hypothetical protein
MNQAVDKSLSRFLKRKDTACWYKKNSLLHVATDNRRWCSLSYSAEGAFPAVTFGKIFPECVLKKPFRWRR